MNQAKQEAGEWEKQKEELVRELEHRKSSKLNR